MTVSLPPSGATYYVPITLTNSQSTATPSPFQQMVNITENSTIDNYLTYNGNSANFEYISPSGTVLPAWIESNNSGNIVTWVKLPNGIPADSYTVIYLEFVANTINLLSNSGTSGIGEAPQLSPTYAEYDDGASVFNNYWNFAGTSLPSGWVASSSADVAINNGYVVGWKYAPAWGRAGISYGTSLTGSYVYESYAKDLGNADTGNPTIFNQPANSITSSSTYTTNGKYK